MLFCYKTRFSASPTPGRTWDLGLRARYKMKSRRWKSKAVSEHGTEEEFKQKQMREDPDMDTFLKRMFLDEEAAHYAEVLRALGITEPKDLAGISQERLVQAGVRKFHARKIGSAEIYRAFL